jgi:hypothetical protein
VQALTWDNPGLSHSVLQIVLDWLSACPVEDIFLCMENVIALITMNDQFQWVRPLVLPPPPPRIFRIPCTGE